MITESCIQITNIYIYIYTVITYAIYIHTEGEIKRETCLNIIHMWQYIYAYSHIYIHIYVYMNPCNAENWNEAHWCWYHFFEYVLRIFQEVLQMVIWINLNHCHSSSSGSSMTNSSNHIISSNSCHSSSDRHNMIHSRNSSDCSNLCQW